MSAFTEGLRSIKDRVLPSTSPDKRAAKLERTRKKAVAEAQRREYQRQDMDSKIHRK